ncbi:MAG TPA: cohesin domain-containing protein [Candidatus Paceibacterota bacterium]|nr:cohesin domain-containing protein [Candidatus Paceibacterota bacterium]
MQVLRVHSIRRAFTYTLAALVFFILPGVIHAATVNISPSTGSYGVGQSFTVNVQVDPEGKSANAAQAQLTFDKTKLSVVNITKTQTFPFWTTEPKFSNTDGTIDFGGGGPTPFSSKLTVVTINFKAIAEGSAQVSVSSAEVTAADGLGTDLYSGPGNGTFTITAASTKPAENPTPTTSETPTDGGSDSTDGPITFGDPPRAPEVGSTIFMDPETWYATKVGTFTWSVPFDVDSMALDISTSSEAEAVTVMDPPIDSIALTEENLIDGVQYLTMKYKNQVDWGATLHRKIMIDTIPPEPFKVNVNAGNSPSKFPLLTFEAHDEPSGIQKYQMAIAGGEPFDITPDEAKLGYLLKDLEDGTYTVKVVAFDYAGNKTEATAAILITAGWHKPVETVITTSIWDFFKGKNLVIILLLLALIAQFVLAHYARKQHELREQKLRKETKEIQDQMEKIFSALRDEIYDQINAITKNERLSKKEKEAVEGLNQALEVSETLIEKEITDVSKILK